MPVLVYLFWYLPAVVWFIVRIPKGLKIVFYMAKISIIFGNANLFRRKHSALPKIKIYSKPEILRSMLLTVFRF